jgi:histone H3/H4
MALSLPSATVLRVAKENIPESVRVSKPAQEGLNRAACVFAMALGVIAGDIAREHKKATLAPNHVLRALEELRFGSFVPPLKESLNALKAVKLDKRVAKKQKIAVEQEEEKEAGGEEEEEEEEKEEEVVQQEEKGEEGVEMGSAKEVDKELQQTKMAEEE